MHSTAPKTSDLAGRTDHRLTYVFQILANITAHHDASPPAIAHGPSNGSCGSLLLCEPIDVVREFDLAVTKSEEETLKDDDEDVEIDVYIDVIEVVVVVNSLRVAKEIAENGAKNDEDFRGSDFS
ncbi:unnamed protein product [Vicia faba]|uniref:Uncharacterized protein n=1 Tax=Vicia faba TaxID=3906 RepID=A0AAV1B9E1_VICFA|nr:unnamed protein product [Vicia faba]